MTEKTEKTENEIFDCGAYAFVKNIPKSMCPTGWERDWMRGYDAARKMSADDMSELFRRKGC